MEIYNVNQYLLIKNIFILLSVFSHIDNEHVSRA